MGCCRGPTRFEFVRRTDGLLADTKKKKKEKILYCNTRSRFFPFVFIGFDFYFYPYHIYPYHIITPILHHSLLFFSFIPTSAFVFSYLVIPSPSLRHMGPGCL